MLTDTSKLRCIVSKRHFLKVINSCLSLSGHSETSGLSDGNEGGGGRHEGRSAKRHQRRSVRSRSRHEKTSKGKLHVLSVTTLILIILFSYNPTMYYTTFSIIVGQNRAHLSSCYHPSVFCTVFLFWGVNECRSPTEETGWQNVSWRLTTGRW